MSDRIASTKLRDKVMTAEEAVRLAGDDGDAMRPKLGELLREALAQFETPDGVYADSSVWVVTARA